MPSKSEVNKDFHIVFSITTGFRRSLDEYVAALEVAYFSAKDGSSLMHIYPII